MDIVICPSRLLRNSYSFNIEALSARCATGKSSIREAEGALNSLTSLSRVYVKVTLLHQCSRKPIRQGQRGQTDVRCRNKINKIAKTSMPVKQLFYFRHRTSHVIRRTNCVHFCCKLCEEAERYLFCTQNVLILERWSRRCRLSRVPAIERTVGSVASQATLLHPAEEELHHESCISVSSLRCLLALPLNPITRQRPTIDKTANHVVFRNRYSEQGGPRQINRGIIQHTHRDVHLQLCPAYVQGAHT